MDHQDNMVAEMQEWVLAAAWGEQKIAMVGYYYACAADVARKNSNGAVLYP
jgi:hypothetical protein